MARRPTQSDRRRVEELLDRFAPEIRAAFMEAVSDLRAGVELSPVIRALETGDLDAAMRAMHLDAAALRRLERAIGSAFAAAGEDAIKTLPKVLDWRGYRVGIRFDPGNPRAARWASENGATLVTRILDDQRASIRETLREGLERGYGPRRTALDIVGRIDPRTGQRTGGIIGLTSSQAEWTRRARDELLSGDAAQLRHYLTRAARDRRFDRSVQRAIAEGHSVDADTAGRAIMSMNNRLLDMRGETVGRSEATKAVGAARHEAMNQTFIDAGIDPSLVVRTWRSTKDARTRDFHASMDMQAAGLNEAFVDGRGNRLMHPGDPSAPAETVINCRCAVTVRILRPDRQE